MKNNYIEQITKLAADDPRWLHVPLIEALQKLYEIEKMLEKSTSGKGEKQCQR